MEKISIIGLSGNSIFYNLNELPKKGETVKAKSIHFEMGGKGMNQAIACNRLGAKVNFLSAIGKDIYGEECIKLMNNEKIDTLFIKKDINTACASILKDDHSNNEVIVFQGANELLDLNDLELFKNKIKESKILLLTYEIPYNVLKEAIKYANKNNVKVVLNPAPYIYDDIDLLQSASVITPNEVEAKAIFNLETLDEKNIKKKIEELGLNDVIITLGDKGSLLYQNRKILKVPAKKVPAKDSTGAGDVYNAALCVKLLEGESLFDSCNFASCASGLSVMKDFVIDSIPSLDEVNKFLKDEK